MAFARGNHSPPERKAPVVYEPRRKHEHTMIILHGRGDTSQNFGGLFSMSETSWGPDLRSLLPHTKLIFPSAKYLPVRSSNYRAEFSQWFDIESLGDTTRNEEFQISGLIDTATHLRGLIEAEKRAGILLEKIVLVGLSQGCATALFTLLTFQPSSDSPEAPQRLGAVIGMSGWLPFVKRLDNLLNAANADSKEGVRTRVQDSATSLRVLGDLCTMTSLPRIQSDSSILGTAIFLGHGTEDEKVRVQHGEAARDVLERLGFEVDWTPYVDFGHWYKEPEEIDDIVNFMRRKVGITIDTEVEDKHSKDNKPSLSGETGSIVFEN